jgi:hypothetical protein
MTNNTVFKSFSQVYSKLLFEINQISEIINRIELIVEFKKYS